VNADNVFHNLVESAVIRSLASIDNNGASNSKGLLDRRFWAWSMSDIPNLQLQGQTHGWMRLWAAGRWPFQTDESHFRNRVQVAIEAIRNFVNSDGSIDQVFRHERSWAATAFLAYDLLHVGQLADDLNFPEIHSTACEVAEPLVRFLTKSRESHATISNHIACGAAVHSLWSQLMSDTAAETLARAMLDITMSKRSSEGWFPEYSGADPGYQTQALMYLSDIASRHPTLLGPDDLAKTIDFLAYFVAPDGSIGGNYGSRATRFYFPSGLELLGRVSPSARALAHKLRIGVQCRRTVTLESIDVDNFTQMFNSYCWAASILDDCANEGKPIRQSETASFPRTKMFPEAGLIVYEEADCYTVISSAKGGLVHHYLDGSLKKTDDGVLFQARDGQLYSTQGLNPSNKVRLSANAIYVESQFSKMESGPPGPLAHWLMRGFALSLFRIPYLTEKFKKFVVRRVAQPNRFQGKNVRVIHLGRNLEISDDSKVPSSWTKRQESVFFHVRMASRGYWQTSDEELF